MDGVALLRAINGVTGVQYHPLGASYSRRRIWPARGNLGGRRLAATVGAVEVGAPRSRLSLFTRRTGRIGIFRAYLLGAICRKLPVSGYQGRRRIDMVEFQMPKSIGGSLLLFPAVAPDVPQRRRTLACIGFK